MNSVRTTLFLGMCVVTSVCFLLQAIILFLYRYLQTSVALAIKKGDATADSLAYIFSICLPTDDMTEDKCLRPVSVAPSAAPSFASSKLTITAPPPPPQSGTAQTLEQAAATLAGSAGLNVSQSNMSAAADASRTSMSHRVYAGVTPTNNSARVERDSGTASTRSSVVSVAAPARYRYGLQETVPGNQHAFM